MEEAEEEAEEDAEDEEDTETERGEGRGGRGGLRTPPASVACTLQREVEDDERSCLLLPAEAGEEADGEERGRGAKRKKLSRRRLSGRGGSWG